MISDKTVAAIHNKSKQIALKNPTTLLFFTVVGLASIVLEVFWR